MSKRIAFRNFADTFTSYFRNSATATRQWLFQDRDGTIADDTDLALKANLASPTFTGIPAAPTAGASTSTTQVATTAFVQQELTSQSLLTLISITGAITLTTTAFGKLHVCSGTAANYTIGLPTAIGNTGSMIAFKGAATLTRLVTLDGNSTETIDGSTTLAIWSGENITIVSDGSNWVVSNYRKKPLKAMMRLNANATITNNTLTKIALDVITYDPSTRMGSTSNNRIDIARDGWYRIDPNVHYNSVATAAGVRFIATVYKNGTGLITFDAQGYAVSTLPNPKGSGLLVSLVAGDYIELYTLQNSGNNQTVLGSPTGSSAFLTVEESI